MKLYDARMSTADCTTVVDADISFWFLVYV